MIGPLIVEASVYALLTYVFFHILADVVDAVWPVR